jgi:hypothetical protein
MPVWGYQFIGRFLEFCLPTLLAPNNIPAIAQALPSRFVLLSSSTDEAIIRAHPAWQKLEQHCIAEIWSIDDLITQGNHTATITLAFERALRQSGDAMRDTCFVFLMSDYLMADGSLQTVLRTIQNGASTVLAGNFQVIAEDATPLLRQRIDPSSHDIVLQPRDLVRWSLIHLHPATVANVVNFGLTHNDHTNRLFWRVDENCLIGRFYLMHPIAIHPETTDFTVGSSWDYSFVPELCPSGKIVRLTDSDDYLVVELQRRQYEFENLRPGPAVPELLARSLAEWATEAHRQNVEETIIFHAAERPANLGQVTAQADAFINDVRRALASPPLSHRQHPYWTGSIAVNRYRGHRPLDKNDWSFVLNDRRVQPNPLLQQLRGAFFGFPPGVTSLHPLWPDYAPTLKALNQILSINGRALLVAQDCEPFAQWVVGTASDVVTLNIDHLLQLTRLQYDGLAGAFDTCLLIGGEAVLEQCDDLLEHVAPLLKPNGHIILLAINSLLAPDATEFSRNFAAQAGRLLKPSVALEKIHYVALSPSRMAIRNTIRRAISQTGVARFLAVTAVPASFANYFINLAARTSDSPPRGPWSSVCVTMRCSDHPAPYPQRLMGKAALDSPAPAGGIRAKELQPSLTPMPQLEANCPWRNTPAELTSHLAHYRFVGSIMGLRHDVAEYGCSTPLGPQLLLRQFRKLTLFDPRPLVVSDLQWRFEDDWRFATKLHDVLVAPLPRPVDSAYCIDFIQYISRDEEDIFIRNLRDSLAYDSGFVIVGSPTYRGHAVTAALQTARPTSSASSISVTAQPGSQDVSCQTERQSLEASGDFSYPEAPSKSVANKSGIYGRTGPELQALMARFFQNVFMFSMIDDVAQPGIHPDAMHVFALGCSKPHVR